MHVRQADLLLARVLLDQESETKEFDMTLDSETRRDKFFLFVEYATSYSLLNIGLSPNQPNITGLTVRPITQPFFIISRFRSG